MDLSFSSVRADSILGPGAVSALIRAELPTIEAALRGEAWNRGMLGWFSVEGSAPLAELERIEAAAARIRGLAGTLIVVGIGGSNRGAAAAIAALGPGPGSPARVVFAGDTLSGSELGRVLEIVKTDSVYLDVIAKDFNTVEPGIAFRVLRKAMEDKYGPACAERVLVTGSRGPGQLRELALRHGWSFLDFPASVGGRFSVLSAVGLLPMAAAGLDIRALVAGAKATEADLKALPAEENPAVRYAACRRLLFSGGFGVESLALFEPSLVQLARWWVQLFAETEGKTEEAIFPTYFSYSEDLHAVGQYVQQGRRIVSETFLRLFRGNPGFMVPKSEAVADGFGYLEGKPYDELNRAVYAAALEAHAAGGVPCLELSLPRLDAAGLGGLFYFFLFSCYISACLLGVNPFDQEGVEGYKRNMYRLLGKGEGR